MKIKTSELTGAALDWAVAKCEGYKPTWDEVSEDFFMLPAPNVCFLKEFKPATYWSQGGPIIERAYISTSPHTKGNKLWAAVIVHANSVYRMYGPTPLIAACRCYVASKLGDEVEIPEGLK